MPKSSLKQALHLQNAVFGRSARVVTRCADVLAHLAKGESSVVTELLWGDERHQIVLTRLEGGRIYFLNGRKTAGGPDQGPTRRFEADGSESMTLAEFETAFRGGRALL